MDEFNNQQPQQTQQQPQPQYQQPQQPQYQQQPQPQYAYAAQPYGAPAKKKTGLIAGLCIGGAALIAIIVVLALLLGGNPLVGSWKNGSNIVTFTNDKMTQSGVSMSYKLEGNGIVVTPASVADGLSDYIGNALGDIANSITYTITYELNGDELTLYNPLGGDITYTRVK